MSYRKKKPRGYHKPHYHRGNENEEPENDSTNENGAENTSNPPKEELTGANPSGQGNPSEREPRRERRPNPRWKNKSRNAPPKDNEASGNEQNDEANESSAPQVNLTEDSSNYVITREIIKRKEEQNQNPDAIICPVCQMPIRSLTTAIRHQESGQFAHFDCVLRELTKEKNEVMSKHRKVYYIGGGNFAVVREHHDRKGRLKTYNIIEKFTYEKRD